MMSGVEQRAPEPLANMAAAGVLSDLSKLPRGILNAGVR